MSLSDPRVGSGRDNSSSPSLSRLISGHNSSSLETLLATLIPVLVYASVCIILFLVLRTRCPRVYSPRTCLTSLPDHERSPNLLNGLFKWWKPFWQIPVTVALDHSSLDGFLFLRFVKILIVISLVGCCLLCPVLLPLHATAGGGHTQLDQLAFGNIVNPRKYYAHALLAWIYFGFILYMIVRECIFCINIRQAYLMSPFYAERLSSRTVLFTCVPRDYLSESRLRATFGNGIKKVWLPRDTDHLEDLVKERDRTAFRLEKAEIALIMMANAARMKMAGPQSEAKLMTSEAEVERRKRSAEEFFRRKEGWDSNSPAPSVEHTLPDVSGSVASQWIPVTARPHHRPVGNYGRRVDTIKWCRIRLKKLSFQIKKERRKLLSSQDGLLPSVFLEFYTQKDAQIACQTLSHHRPLHMSNRYVAVRPYEIIWASLSMTWWSRIVRKFSMRAFLVVMIIFWSLPCAIVGLISNIQLIAIKVGFLHFVLDLPKPVLALFSGLIPAIALSLLMDAVPWIVRSCARVAGTPSLSTVEIYTQHNYFAFQVVQVFLVTTLTSAISASLTQILEKPASALNLLSQNLPKSSNFYISYILVQCLGFGANQLVPIFSLFNFQVAQRISKDNRRSYERWHRMRRIHWGTKFPVFTNLGVIVMSYSMIAPLILCFSTLGFCFIYAVYRYNILYIYDSEIDTRGLVYPNALSHLLVGLYFAEVCLIGLFALQYAAGPIALTIALLIFTILVHVSLLDAVGPLLTHLPVSLGVEEKELIDNNIPVEEPSFDNNDNPAEESDPEAEADETPEPGDSRAIEGLPAGFKIFKSGIASILRNRIKSEAEASGFALPADSRLRKTWTSWTSPTLGTKPNILLKWLHPEVFADASVFRAGVPSASVLPDPLYPVGVEEHIYEPPAMYAEVPRLWIPRDAGGVSAQEVKHSGRVVGISDEDGVLDERGQMRMDFEVLGYLRRDDAYGWGLRY